MYKDNKKNGDVKITLTANWNFKSISIDDRWYIWKATGYYTSPKVEGRLCAVRSGTERCYNKGLGENVSINANMFGTFKNVGSDKYFEVLSYVEAGYRIVDARFKENFGESVLQ